MALLNRLGIAVKFLEEAQIHDVLRLGFVQFYLRERIRSAAEIASLLRTAIEDTLSTSDGEGLLSGHYLAAGALVELLLPRLYLI